MRVVNRSVICVSSSFEAEAARAMLELAIAGAGNI
jgi:hypothetical protein